MRNFATYHPCILCLYFLIFIGFTMFTTQPFIMGLAFLFSQILYRMVSSSKSFYKHLSFMVCMILIIGCSNPLFVHQGITILFYMNGNPITLEAILYGFGFGVMICSVLTQFIVLQKVMTTDKFMYLFSKIIPTSALIISMTLRLIPKFQKQAKEIFVTQKILGFDIHHGSILRRVKVSLMMFSMMITWAFESSVEGADSMRARGYGTKHRTYFSMFKFENRDGTLLCFLICILLGFGCAYAQSFTHFYYYPSVNAIHYGVIECLGYICFGSLGLIPIVIEWKEQRKWKYVASKM